MKEFNSLVKLLRKKGYTVKVKTEQVTELKPIETYKSAMISGKSIRGGFCFTEASEHSWVYHDIRNLISFDNVKCFDKWRKCPIRGLPYPKNEEEQKLLLAALKFITSKKGFKKSNEYEIWEISSYEAIKKMLEENL
jgi:hypothetical protein